jgi:hypothetical protein
MVSAFRAIARGTADAPRAIMRAFSGIALVLVLTPSVAAAGPVTVGASLGLSEAKIDADNGADATQTLGLWGRLAFSPRVAGQLEVLRYKAESGCAQCTFGTTTNIRTATASLVVDLSQGGKLVPTLIAGIGLDRNDGSFTQTGRHIEGGLGVEYRGEGGVTIGADARLGSRTLDEGDVIAVDDGETGVRVLPAFQATELQAGEYRSIRITLGVRF